LSRGRAGAVLISMTAFLSAAIRGAEVEKRTLAGITEKGKKKRIFL
jgi:hypothetical protein